MDNFLVGFVIKILTFIGDIGLITLIILVWILYKNRKFIAPYYFLNKKVKTDIQLRLIERSYKESEKLHILLRDLNDSLFRIQEDDQKTNQQKEISEKLERFSHHFQHLCVLILSKIAEDTVFKYKYCGIIKICVEEKYIEMIHTLMNEPFISEDYQWLEDTYQLAVNKKFIKKENNEQR